MRRLVQFLRSKWEEILVTGIWLPLVLAAVSAMEPIIIALSVVGGVVSLFGLYSLVDQTGAEDQRQAHVSGLDGMLGVCERRRAAMMDAETYHIWWALHLRVARGASLTTEDQATYEAGGQQLHQEENLHEDIAVLQQARATIAALEAEQAQWRAQHAQLEAEIATLEAA